MNRYGTLCGARSESVFLKYPNPNSSFSRRRTVPVPPVCYSVPYLSTEQYGISTL